MCKNYNWDIEKKNTFSHKILYDILETNLISVWCLKVFLYDNWISKLKTIKMSNIQKMHIADIRLTTTT